MAIEDKLGIARRKLLELKSDVAVLRLRLAMKRFDEVLHPRWPAGTPDSQGGEFRPAEGQRVATVTRNGMTIVGGWNEGNRATCTGMFDLDLALCEAGAPSSCEKAAIDRFGACMTDMAIPRLGFGGR